MAIFENYGLGSSYYSQFILPYSSPTMLHFPARKYLNKLCINNIIYIILIFLNSTNHIFAEDFNSWVITFKDYAMKKGISK